MREPPVGGNRSGGQLSRFSPETHRSAFGQDRIVGRRPRRSEMGQIRLVELERARSARRALADR
jgi:hypothetical protein